MVEVNILGSTRELMEGMCSLENKMNSSPFKHDFLGQHIFNY